MVRSDDLVVTVDNVSYKDGTRLGKALSVSSQDVLCFLYHESLTHQLLSVMR